MSPAWVLPSTQWAAGDITIYLGHHSNDDWSASTSRGVSQIHLNPAWTASASFGANVYEGSDTAVLTLSAPVEYTETIRPVCLPADPADTFVDRVARCTGWGGLLNGGFPDELMEVDRADGLGHVAGTKGNKIVNRKCL